MVYASTADVAAWNSYIGGALAVFVAVSALLRPASKTEEWVNLALGLWVFASPFAFAFYAAEAVAA